MNDDLFKSKISKLDKVFNVPSLLNREKTMNPELISRYYRRNQLAYRLFNSHAGFVHMGISDGSNFKQSDFLKQLDIIQELIKVNNAKNILELAAGKGANIQYLADLNPSSQFFGIDLANGQFKTKTKIKNAKFVYSDYHDLSYFADNSMDIVYVIEALCHSSNKGQVINEVERILKNGGLFVVIDGYFSKDINDYAPDKMMAIKLVASSMVVTNRHQTYAEFLKHLRAKRLRVIKQKDYSKQILPSLYRLENKAVKLIEHPKIGKLIIWALGDLVVGNAVAGYLMPACVENNLFEYRYTLAQKPK